MTIICAISDTHEQHKSVSIPKCDLLIHAGDITGRGSLGKLRSFNAWVADLLDSGHVGEAVYIAGNHDITLEGNSCDVAEALLQAGTYLNCTTATVCGLTVHGIPHQLKFCDWAFNTDEARLTKLFDAVPQNTDILVTHGPPHGVRDRSEAGTYCGSVALYNWIKKNQPKMVVCGHIHEGWGAAMVDNTLVVNASICTAAYKPTNQPIVVEL